MHKDKSMMTLEDDEQTNQPTPSPLHEKEEAKKIEKHEKGIACDDEPKVEASKES